RLEAIRVDIEPSVQPIHSDLIVGRLDIHAAQLQAHRWSRCGNGLAYASASWRPARLDWKSASRRREIPEIARTEGPDRCLSSGKPNELVLARWIIASIDQGLGCLLVRHSRRFKWIADVNWCETTHDLIKAGDRLRSRHQDVRAAEN